LETSWSDRAIGGLIFQIDIMAVLRLSALSAVTIGVVGNVALLAMSAVLAMQAILACRPNLDPAYFLNPP
jgi:hypothetical protein